MTPEMLEALHPYLDAANVDLKAFRDETYRKYVGGRLQPVLDNLKLMRQLGLWLEVTSLVIPGLNDDAGELRDVAQFIVQELGPQTPWHISRFVPAFRMKLAPPTPVETLTRAKEIGCEAGLRYVYVGNVPHNSHTYCHACGETLVYRAAWAIAEDRITRTGRCPRCHTPVAGVGMGGAHATAT
jgi:pyruvate formate lyase activating enzyme